MYRRSRAIITAAPSPATRTTAKQLSPHVKEGQKIVNISKGLEEGTLLRLFTGV